MGNNVKIVGAGPGDMDLLTVKAYNLIRDWADVIIYDRLISDDIIALFPSNIEAIYAGKSCKNHVMSQDEINTELVKYASSGKRILRLKGGDPFIFGRGAEEVIALNEAGIECEVVSGVSAASGISSSVGIPLTHRGLANSVQFITGHQQKNKETKIDWDSLSNKELTIVLYMALTHIDNIVEKLIAGGRESYTPAVAIENGTMENERLCFADLQNLPSEIGKMELKSPTIIIIGDVVKLSPYSTL